MQEDMPTELRSHVVISFSDGRARGVGGGRHRRVGHDGVGRQWKRRWKRKRKRKRFFERIRIVF